MSTPLLTTLSTRQRLARTALSAALAVDGVVAGSAGRQRTHVTAAGPELLQGILVVAQPGDRYSVSLLAICRPVPLLPLAERIRAQVHQAAEAAGLADRLGPISVRIDDIVEPTEPVA